MLDIASIFGRRHVEIINANKCTDTRQVVTIENETRRAGGYLTLESSCTSTIAI